MKRFLVAAFALACVCACFAPAAVQRNDNQTPEHPLHLRRRSVVQDGRLLSRIVAVGEDAEHRCAGQVRRAVPRRAYLGAWCMPSRASLLTGPAPARHRVDADGGDVSRQHLRPEAVPVLAAVFREHGYHTAQIGKWHTGTDAGFGRDWDYQIVWNRPKHPDNAGATTRSRSSRSTARRRRSDGYPADNYTKWACEYVERRRPRQEQAVVPVAVLRRVHGPSKPAARHKGLYKDARSSYRPTSSAPWPGKPDYLKTRSRGDKDAKGEIRAGRRGEKVGDEAGARQDVRRLGAAGQRVRPARSTRASANCWTALSETGQLENTLVIYTADQGFAMGEHGMRMKIAPYDANYRSPLIVSFARYVAEGKVCVSPVCAGDLTATFCALAGVKLPWEVHGRDLMPVLKSPETREEPRALLFEEMGQKYGSDLSPIPAGEEIYHSDVPRWVVIRYGKYKYIRYLAGEMEEIYDVEADPKEPTNLALKSENRALLADLRSKTIAELSPPVRPFVDTLPPTKQMQQ